MLQTSIGLAALSAAHFHSLRTGETQNVSVDARHAVLEFSEFAPLRRIYVDDIDNDE